MRRLTHRGLGAALGALSLFSTLLLSSCMGSSTVKVEQRSPSGKYLVKLTESESGAAGEWISDVTVSETHPTLRKQFTGPRKGVVFAAELSSQHISLVWKADAELQIVCRACDPGKVLVMKSNWGDVAVSYLWISTPGGKP